MKRLIPITVPYVSPAMIAAGTDAIAKDARWKAFFATLAEVRKGFDDLSGDELQARIDEAVSAVRRRAQ